jgi:copper chaperone CopZ
MKKLLSSMLGMIMMIAVHAQFTNASLQATGLTCAMCSNAINKALKAIPYVSSVKPDIKNSAFDIVFKQDADVDIDQLKKAVEDAGFAIGSLKITGRFNDVAIAKDKHVRIGSKQYHFLNATNSVLTGEQTLTVVDKDFLTARQFKKISASTQMGCLQTGKAASCCVKDGIASGTRIYHVTI